MNEIRKFVCDPLLGGCGKNCKEQRGLKGFRSYVGGVDEKEVEVEYVDLCEKCGKAKLREQKLLMRVTGAAAAEILPEEELKKFSKWSTMTPYEKKCWIENFQRLEREAKKKGGD